MQYVSCVLNKQQLIISLILPRARSGCLGFGPSSTIS